MDRNSEMNDQIAQFGQYPIGVFDSGLGGLSVWKEIRSLLPYENLLYVADQANCPYGPQKAEAVIAHAEKIVRFLRAQHCKIIVLACNTATAAAISYLRQTYDFPFVGMEPATKLAAQHTRTGVIGILATEGTFRGKHFQQTKERYAHHLETVIKVGEGLVELVEKAQHESTEAYTTLQALLEPMLKKKVDQLVLGCSHYPFLLPAIRQIVGEKMEAIDPAPAVARQVRKLLIEEHLLNPSSQPGNSIFYTTASAERLTFFLQHVLNEPLTENSVQVLKASTTTHEWRTEIGQ